MKVDPLLGWIPSKRQWVPSLRYLLRRARVLVYGAQLPGSNLLEVGCGAGVLLIEFAKAGKQCTGLESSPAALSLAREMASEAGVSIEWAHDERPEWHRAFDAICAFDVLEHIEDDSAALSLWHSWLRPSGKVLLTVPAHRSRWSAGDEWAGHFRRYERGELLAKMEAAGFSIESVECYGFPLANLTEWLGSRTYRIALSRQPIDQSAASGRSGIDRRVYQKALPLIQSWLGSAGLRTAMWLQKAFRNTDLGSGYLVLARVA